MYNTHIYTTHKHVYTHKYTTYQLTVTAVPWVITQREGSGSIKTAVNLLALSWVDVEEEKKKSPAGYENEEGCYIHDYLMKEAVQNCAKKKWAKLWRVPVLEGRNPLTVLLWVHHAPWTKTINFQHTKKSDWSHGSNHNIEKRSGIGKECA